MIKVKAVKKNYHVGEITVKALKGVDLEIKKGEFLSIAGPSGSGKTSLLNIVGCLDKASEGTIIFDDVNIQSMSKKELTLFRRENMGFIFQSYNLIPVLTAFENVSFSLSLLKMKPAEIHDATMTILKEVGLMGMEDRRPSELSGGQQQRVAIARALVKKPDLILADEPTANLDSATGEAILQLMEDLNEKYKTTFIFSTHDPMVMEKAKRLVMLHDGLISSDKTK